MCVTWFLTNQERENPHTRIDDIRGDGTAWSSGNTVRAIVHGRPYFAELHERISALGPGDRLYFADWQGEPDQLLTDDPGSTLSATLVAAVERGVDVRGLLWRSHWHRIGYSAHRHRQLGEEISEAGGQCLRDMRVRTRGAHHQKFVVIRHRDDPARDIAYVGGIDLCHGRRDDHDHHGDPQAVELAKAYGPTPAWHDVQVAIQGPAVHDVETTFRERWEDSTPLTVNPGRLLSSLFHREDLSAEPLGDQSPPPEPRPDGHDIVQIVRTFPVIQPKGFDFAPEGERSVMLSNTKAIAQADRLVYVEDQYLWSEDVGEHFAAALRDKPDLRLVVVLPMVPDLEGAVAEVPQLYGRSLAMRTIMEAGGDRVAVFGLCNDGACPSTCTPRPASSTTAGRASAPTTSTAVRGRATARSRAPSSTRAATWTRRRPRTPSPGCCSAPWSPSTWAASPTTSPRTRTSCSTRWWPAPRPSTSGTAMAAPTSRAASEVGSWVGCPTASHRSPARWRPTSRAT